MNDFYDCWKCKEPIRYGEGYHQIDINAGAAAAGSGNWKRVHSRCVPVNTYSGPVGFSSTEVRDAALEDAAKVASGFMDKCDETACKAVGCDSFGVKCEEAIAHAIRAMKTTR